jgi:hypothetical protein
MIHGSGEDALTDEGLIYIYIPLIEHPESLDCCKATRVHELCFRLLESSSDSEHHSWGYCAGDIVRCIKTEFYPGEWGYRVQGRCTCDG